MVFGLGRGPKRGGSEKQKPVQEEVRFWQAQLDKAIEDKNKWQSRFTSAARHNEVLRGEVFLLQQATAAPRQHSAPRQHLSIANSRSEHAGGSSKAAPHHPSSGQQAAANLTSSTAAAHAHGEEDVLTAFIPTPAAKRFQAPCSASKSSARYDDEGEPAAKLRQESENLKKLLQEAQLQNSSLKGELERQHQQHDFLAALAEAYKKESQQLREQLLTQHGINDETADETCKVLSELARLQQTNALLTRDMLLKDSMIQLLQQELSDLSSQMLPPTPRARSPERSSSSSSSETSSDARLHSLWETEHQEQLLWESEQHVLVHSEGATMSAPGLSRAFEQAAALRLNLDDSSGEACSDGQDHRPAAAVDTWGSGRLLSSSSVPSSMQGQADDSQAVASSQHLNAPSTASQYLPEAAQGGRRSPDAASSTPWSTDTMAVLDTAQPPMQRAVKASSRPLRATAPSCQKQRARPELLQAGGWEGSATVVIVQQGASAKTGTESRGAGSKPQRLSTAPDSESDEDDLGRHTRTQGIRTPDSYGHRFAALH